MNEFFLSLFFWSPKVVSKYSEGGGKKNRF